MKTNQIRIVSDGTHEGTRVYDAKGQRIDTGQSGIKAIVWAVAAEGVATCSIVLFDVAVDVVGVQEQE